MTTALHRAAACRWGSGRPGGVVYWDHDLFASCAIEEDGSRLYPEHPNEFTPLPGSTASDRWAVVSSALADEAATYPTSLRPRVVTNVLPTVPDGGLAPRHHEFLRAHGLSGDQPILLAPVRLFAVKGVEISVELLAGMRAACARAGTAHPVLLVFGSLAEDPDYVTTVRSMVTAYGIEGSVVFLDGVPLSSYRDDTGTRSMKLLTAIVAASELR